MRNTQQCPSGQEEGYNATLQQLMENVNTLQQVVTMSKADQERVLAEVRAEQAHRQDQFRVEFDTSRASTKELCRANEELWRDLQRLGERAAGEQSPPIPVRARPMSFSQAIMNVVIPTNFMTPIITFTGTEDPAHISTFHTFTGSWGRWQAQHWIGSLVS